MAIDAQVQSFTSMMNHRMKERAMDKDESGGVIQDGADSGGAVGGAAVSARPNPRAAPRTRPPSAAVQPGEFWDCHMEVAFEQDGAG